MKEKIKKFVEDHKFELIFGGTLIGVVGGILIVGAIKSSSEPDPIVVDREIIKKIWLDGVDYGFGLGCDEDTKFWKNFPEVAKAIEKAMDEYIKKNGTGEILMSYTGSYERLDKILAEVLK